MPTIYLSKELYDKMIKLGKEPSQFVNTVTEEALKKLEREK